MVVGRCDPVDLGERPERRPDLQQVLGEPAGAFVAWRLAGIGAQARVESALQLTDLTLELSAIPGLLERVEG